MRASTARSAHARQGRRRSVGTTTRSRLGARSAGVAGAGSDRAEPAMQRKRRGDVTRHTAHTTRECVRVCRRRDRRTHDEVGGARSARRLARGSALARRASPEPAMQRKRHGDVTRHTTHTTREYVGVCRRRDRRTHDEVGGARSARRLARGSALARRRRCRLRQSQAGGAMGRTGAVMSLAGRRRPRQRSARVRRRDDRCAHDRVGGARSAERLAHGSALA